MLYRLLRPLLFRIDPETSHAFAFAALRPLQRALQRFGPAVSAPDPLLRQALWGLNFPHPIGLAAGFDKNGELPHVWAAMGFGFAELGTVTDHAQPGNPRPRLFRLPADRALINRLGFNNRGAAAVAVALARRLRHHRPPIPLGVNLGKSARTPLAEASADYRNSLRALFPTADYVAINVSSPNTPGLRDLQSEAYLTPLLTAIQEENRRLASARGVAPLPLLVKVAPDLGDDELRSIVSVAQDCQVAGIIATNTTVHRESLYADDATASEGGGLSGAPLSQRSTAVIRTLYCLTEGRLPIIGVGGIFSALDAYEKIRAGASLLQVYTSLIYEGPRLPHRLCAGLRQLLARDGFTHIAAAVGRDAGLGHRAPSS